MIHRIAFMFAHRFCRLFHVGHTVANSAKFQAQIQTIFGQLLERSSFIYAGFSSQGIDRKTGEELLSVFFESPDWRLRFFQADGEANILVASMNPAILPKDETNWQYLRSLVSNGQKMSFEELLSRIPEVPLSKTEQLLELRPLLEGFLASRHPKC